MMSFRIRTTPSTMNLFPVGIFGTDSCQTVIPTVSASLPTSMNLVSSMSSIPLQLFSEGNRLTKNERDLLEAAQKGDKATILRCLKNTEDPVNVNVTDIMGRSALQMAVDNENIEIVEILLAQENVFIGDALLYAIKEGVYKMVEMMVNHPSISVEMLGEGWYDMKNSLKTDSSDYSPDISPIILAAHVNEFEILQLLLTRGASIFKPHSVICDCDQCKVRQKHDSLRYSLKRINAYKALASPAWMALTSNDPILTAFRLSWELQHMAMRENEFKDIYLTLLGQCKRFAVDLLDQCRSTEEVVAVMNKTNDSEDQLDEEVDSGNLTLSRLKLALKYEQKQFVAHAHTQQLLSTIWYEGLPSWRRRHWTMKIVTCALLLILQPFLSIYYLVFPRSHIGNLLRTPFMKFLNHSVSFVCFLILLVLASAGALCPNDSRGIRACSIRKRGRQPDAVEILLIFWVLGMIWAECKQLWEEGLKAYTRQWWNWLDFIMLSLYLCALSLRTVAYMKRHKFETTPESRCAWPIYDPTIVSECIFAVAIVFSFARIIYLFQANQYLGPLQISLGNMLIDIAKFLFIFLLVLLSFTCGMNQLFTYYNTSSTSNTSTTGRSFVSWVRSLFSLFWALFGLLSKDEVNLDINQFVEFVGELMLLSYHVLGIIVLLNMLIAMMSSSFQNIENHADEEWKFARSKLWMGYFDEGSTLPPPFNLIISPKSIYYAFTNIKQLMCSQCIDDTSLPGSRQSLETALKSSDSSILGSTLEQETKYQDIMKRLVSRYIHQYKAEQKGDGVTEDDLNEIKQDISSLRYELREDRKKEQKSHNMLLQDIKRTVLYHSTGDQSRSNSHPSSDSKLATHRDLEKIKLEIIECIKSGFCTSNDHMQHNNRHDVHGRPTKANNTRLPTEKSFDEDRAWLPAHLATEL